MNHDDARTSAAAVLQREFELIRERRAVMAETSNLHGEDLSATQPPDALVGLALSGGGIRSATFNLGLVQAMQRYGLYDRVDYLSTVSGGGYLGSCLSWFATRLKNRRPFGTRRADAFSEGGRMLRWLRQHGSYLTPGDGLNRWALAGAILMGMLVNLLVFTPLFYALVWLLASPSLAQIPAPLVAQWYQGDSMQSLFPYLLLASGGMVFAFVVLSIVFALFSGSYRAYRIYEQRAVRIAGGQLLRWGAILAAAGAVPLVYSEGREIITSLTSGVMGSGLAAVFSALKGRTPENENRGYRALLIPLGLGLLLYGLLLWLYHLVASHGGTFPAWMWGLVLISLLVGVFGNINRFSMYRFYRNRLVETFHPYQMLPDRDERQADYVKLAELDTRLAPYHLINCNMVTVCSSDPTLRARAGDNFIFSPAYCGSPSTAYMPTAEYLGGSMDLGSAMAISGAAVDPNTAVTRSRPLSFLMTLLNLRLGFWVRNPARPATVLGRWSRPWWHWYLLREMLGLSMDETQRHVHLNDGGHFENLGLYELIRRRCRYIVVSDASADPGWDFGDLAKAIELVRVDFGVEIIIDTQPLHPRGEERLSSSPFVVGKIRYADEEKSTGILLYIKSSVIADLPEDIYSYRRINDCFPDQTTADQFFDEPQFEAYRELGYRIGKRAFSRREGGTVTQWQDEEQMLSHIFDLNRDMGLAGS